MIMMTINLKIVMILMITIAERQLLQAPDHLVDQAVHVVALLEMQTSISINSIITIGITIGTIIIIIIVTIVVIMIKPTKYTFLEM